MLRRRARARDGKTGIRHEKSLWQGRTNIENKRIENREGIGIGKIKKE